MTSHARQVVLALALVLLAQPARGQGTPPDPVSTAVRADAERLSRDLVAAADDMPAAKYGFKPTPPQMSVAEVVLHLGGDNAFGCAAIGATKAPEEPKLTPGDSPPKLIARLKRSFAFCNSVLAKVHDATLGEKVPGFDSGQVTRAAMMLEMHEDWADHYSQLANYLRLSGILPPTARGQKQP